MKYRILFFTIVLFPVLLFFASCAKELEFEPTGSVLTPDQLKEAGKLSQDRANVIFKGMYGELKRFNRLGNSPAYAYDFGYSSFALMLDHLSDKMWSVDHRYNWYRSVFKYVALGETSAITYLLYSSYYAYIAEANKVLNTVSDETDEGKSFRAQARAFRAFAYLNLIQSYQFTYKGNEQAAGVPIVRENMTRAQQIDNKRASVEEVYNYILEDLNYAKDILQDSIPKQKSTIGGCAVYGLLARTHLLMQNWEEAYMAAQKALEIAGRANITPLRTAEANRPGFNDIRIHNVIWGIDYTPDDLVTKSEIMTWESMMCSLKYGQNAPLTYAVRGFILRKVNPDFYETIDPTDVRKAWFYTPEYDAGLRRFLSDAGATAAELDDQIKLIVEKQWKGQLYANIKFAPYQGNPGARINATDFPLMRVEELYYIQAEAIARDNEAEGIKRLESFITNYRQPTYNYEKNQARLGQTTFTQEIYRQRALEFWGEGITFYDMMRLGLPLTREGALAKRDPSAGGYPLESRFNIPAGDNKFLFQFPREEILNNRAVQQNPVGEQIKDTF